MRSDLRGKAIAVAAAVSLVAEATFAQPASWSTSTEPFRIVDGIYYVGTEGLAYLIVTPHRRSSTRASSRTTAQPSRRRSA